MKRLLCLILGHILAPIFQEADWTNGKRYLNRKVLGHQCRRCGKTIKLTAK